MIGTNERLFLDLRISSSSKQSLCTSQLFKAKQRRAYGRVRALEAWNDFSKKLITPKPLISPFPNFYSISWNVLGVLLCKKKEKKLGSFLAISISL